MIASRKGLFSGAMAGLICVQLSGCFQSLPEEPLPGKEFWDTSFSLQGIPLTSDSVVSRSRVEMGNNFRLARFFRKCEAAPELKLGFIGGSITEGAGASDTAHRYVGRLCDFLSKTFTQTKFVPINAGIGSTDSRFGASRASGDLFAYGPDLIVIEFAVNDDGNDTAGFAETLEGLVRQSLSYTPEAPVLLYQTMNRLGDSLTHKMQERIARHYGIPDIGFRNAMWPLLAQGSIAWSSLSRDDVHPNDTGHLIGGYLLYDCLRKEYGRILARPDRKRPLPAPLFSDLYERAGIHGGTDSAVRVEASTGWEIREDDKGRIDFNSNTPGAKLQIRSSAREITLQFPFRSDLHGRIEVRIDGRARDTISNHFEQGWESGYLRGLRLFKEAVPQDHAIELVNLDGEDFDLRYVLFAP
jgi:lysophospholipase L1-like esterase